MTADAAAAVAAFLPSDQVAAVNGQIGSDFHSRMDLDALLQAP